MTPVRYHDGAFPPDENLNWQALIPLIGQASRAVGVYSGLLNAVPNSNILLAPLMAKEALSSSRIEGTQATMEEVYRFQAGQEPDSRRRADVQEVVNYHLAMLRAQEMLKELPVCQRVVKDVHSSLMRGVRGENKTPGEYRRRKNWIGPPNCTEEEAFFIPIDISCLQDGMNAWEIYIHQESPDPLVKTAILHIEFEALHPFLDGNGRLGRMLIPLLMWQYDCLQAPVFYISEYLESHRDTYYERLRAVSRDGDWFGWCQFFLEAVQVQAETNLGKAQDIIELYSRLKSQVVDLTKSQFAIRALDRIFELPIFSSSSFIKRGGIPVYTARKILRQLRDERIVVEIEPSRGRTPAWLAFSEVIDIANRPIDR